MSTGMQHGIALPHGRSTVIRELAVAVGISRQGVEFQSLDDEPARLIFMVVSPQDNSGPHLQILAGIAGILNREEARRDLLEMKSRHHLIEYMVNNSNAK
jgi:mannitol/fructose-specific phosphotransferase system IIA component (Ntr-type)